MGSQSYWENRLTLSACQSLQLVKMSFQQNSIWKHEWKHCWLGRASCLTGWRVSLTLTRRSKGIVHSKMQMLASFRPIHLHAVLNLNKRLAGYRGLERHEVDNDDRSMLPQRKQMLCTISQIICFDGLPMQAEQITHNKTHVAFRAHIKTCILFPAHTRMWSFPIATCKRLIIKYH